jgi:hypothetical protein
MSETRKEFFGKRVGMIAMTGFSQMKHALAYVSQL